VSSWVAGADGCRLGWFVVLRELSSGTFRYRRVASFSELLRLPERPRVVAIDIPIGLLTAAEPGGRPCDREARRLLAPKRSSSVFSPPAYSALPFDEYCLALGENRASSNFCVGIAKQAFALFDKLREVHDVMTPRLQDHIFEIHPEVSFFRLTKKPNRHSKKRSAGRAERIAALKGFSPVVRRLKNYRPEGVGWDDCLDACVACWTAMRIAAGRAVCLKGGIVSRRDSHGLRMEIWS